MKDDAFIYVLEMEKFRESDISRECPFVPEAEEVDRAIYSLTEDIGNLEGIMNISSMTNNNIVTFEIEAYLAFEELKDEIKIYLSDQICCLRHKSIYKKMYGETK